MFLSVLRSEPDIRHAQIDYSQRNLIIYRLFVFITYNRVVTRGVDPVLKVGGGGRGSNLYTHMYA